MSDSSLSPLIQVRTDIIHHLLLHHDPKKIVSFLNHCGVTAIDEQRKVLVISVPNQFVASQVDKFFGVGLMEAIHEVYHIQYTYQVVVASDFTGHHPLQLDLKTIITTKPTIIKHTIPVLDPQIHTSLQDHFGVLFESKYQFSNFVVGPSSEMAYTVLQTISQSPGQGHNPFFLYGDVGLGKTHLLQATANTLMSLHPELVIVYLPTPKLIDEIIQGIKKNKLDAVIRKFAGVDVLILDDIQFLARKETCQEIFFNLFNDFISHQKHIILSSDRSPKELTLIESRLTTRFATGMICDIGRPNMETRMAILSSKLEAKDIALPNHLIELIATTVTDTVRELEGVINIITQKSRYRSSQIEESDIVDSLRLLGYRTTSIVTATSLPTTQTDQYEDIVTAICRHYGITYDDILSDQRKKSIIVARQLAMLIAKKHFNRTLEKIGSYYGGKNHTTVIYSIEKCEAGLRTDTAMHSLYTQLLPH